MSSCISTSLSAWQSTEVFCQSPRTSTYSRSIIRCHTLSPDVLAIITTRCPTADAVVYTLAFLLAIGQCDQIVVAFGPLHFEPAAHHTAVSNTLAPHMSVAERRFSLPWPQAQVLFEWCLNGVRSIPCMFCVVIFCQATQLQLLQLTVHVLDTISFLENDTSQAAAICRIGCQTMGN